MSGVILVALAYGIFRDGFSKARALMLHECAIAHGSTSGWNRVGTSVSFLIPPSLKKTSDGKWIDGERSVQEGWFVRMGNAGPKMSNACKLDGRTAIFDREVKGDQVWFGLEFLGVTDHGNPPSHHILLAHGKTTDEAVLLTIFSTARVSE